MRRKASLEKRLLLGFGAVILFMLAGTVYSLVVVRGATAAVSRAAAIYDLGRIATTSSELVGLERAIVLHSIFDDKALVDQFKSQFQTASENFDQLLGRMSSELAAEGSADAVEKLRKKHSDWQATHVEVMKLLASQQVDVAQKKLSDPAFVASANDVEQLANQLSERASQVLRAQASASRTKSLTSSLMVILLSLGLGSFVLADIRRLNRKLSGLTASLADSSAQVTKLCGEVSAASESLAQGSAQQAESLERTSSSTLEIKSMTRDNADRSQSAAAVMATVDQNVHRGNHTIQEMMVSMKEISSSSDKISKIIKVIDEIAFQTNILALNAAVEAARAGEAGMGFAVVADEVRNLAQRSAQAARDTGALIAESIAKSGEGSAKLQRVTEVMQAITESSSKVKTLVDEVNFGSQEQARGIEQISTAVAEMDRATQNAASGAKDSASSGRELLTQADLLNQIVQDLRILVGQES
jgi:methyl-accepting chemotaxis protein